MLRIRVFGELEVERGGEKVGLPRSRRARAVLAWLALHPGAHPRSRLAARFWPDVLDASARASLRSAIWALRAAAGDVVIADRDSIALRDEDLWVDAREFARLVAADRLGEAVALCRGELLYEFDEEWAFALRDEHDARLGAALEGLAAEAESAGDLRAAVEWTRRRTGVDPLDESAARDLIRRLADAGDAPGALAEYARVRQRLRAELGIGPAAETRQAAERLRADIETGPAVEEGRGADRPTHLPPLVGRERELGALLPAWERARAGHGTAVALSGEGGIGKTRLSEEVLSVAESHGARALACAAVDLGGGPPFGLWSELLRDLVSEIEVPRADWAADLARLVPGIEVAAPPRPAAEPELERTRLFESVVELLACAARERPLALALEDLHLADASSLTLLGYAGRRIGRLPLLLVLTRRALPPSPPVDAALAALRSRRTLAVELELAPLDAPAVRELARATAELPAGEAEQVVAVAGGSPLLTVEAARAIAHGEGPATGLRGAVRAAMGRLGERARLFVELAAVAGRDLERAEIAALGDPGDAAGEASRGGLPADPAVEALGAGLLQARGARIGFRHALLREVVYDDLPDPQRARLHETLAEALRRAGARRPADIARHFRLAGRDELAVGHLLRAAANARAVAALPEAAGFLREAHEIEPDEPEPLVELAEVEAWRGLLADSDAAFERALERIPGGDSGALVSAWLRRGRWLRGGICHPRESRRSYRNALAALDRDPLARAEALAGLAWAEATAGDPAAVDELLREVSELTGKEAGNELLSHDVGVARGHALLRAGRFAESYGPLIAAAAAAGRSDRPDMAYSCLINAASAAACAGDLERALDFADRSLALVVPNGLLGLGVYAQSARAGVLRRVGRLEEARLACGAAAELADRVGLAELDGLVHHDRGLIALVAGDADAAAEHLALALDRAAPVSRPLTRLHRAEALTAGGRLDEAEAELRAVALEPVSPSDFPDTLVARMSRVEGLIALRRGDPALARRRLGEAEEGWRRRTRRGDELGAEYMTTLVDLGRPPISMLVEPERELERLRVEIAQLHAVT